MKAKLLTCLLSLMFLSFAVCTVIAQSVSNISLGTTSSSSGAYPWHVAHCTEVNKVLKDIHMTAVECPGGAGEVIERLIKRQIDLGISGVDISARAFKGIGMYKGKANTSLRTIAVFMDVPYTFFVTKRSGIKSIYELDGKEFGTGFPNGMTGESARAFFDAIGIKPKYFEAGLGANVAAVKDGRIVGFVKSGSPDASILDIAATMPVTILSITEDDFKKANAKYPDYIVSKSIIPARSYPAQDKDALAITMLGCWLSTNDLSVDLVYKITKVWYEKRATLADIYAPGKQGQMRFPEITINTSIVPLHGGAFKFYKELGLSIPRHLIPPEVK